MVLLTFAKPRQMCSEASRSVIWLPYNESVVSLWNWRSGAMSAIYSQGEVTYETRVNIMSKDAETFEVLDGANCVHLVVRDEELLEPNTLHTHTQYISLAWLHSTRSILGGKMNALPGDAQAT